MAVNRQDSCRHRILGTLTALAMANAHQLWALAQFYAKIFAANPSLEHRLSFPVVLHAIYFLMV